MRKHISGFSLIELMIAISLGTLLCAGVFNLFITIKNLHQRQIVLSETEEKMRFLTQFLRSKIQMAGNWSCLSQSKPPRSIIVRSYNKKQAHDKFGLDIKSKTNLLLLHECIRFNDKQDYLPIEFFVANTFRENNHHKIDALFFKIEDHPREELITDINQFKIRLYRVPYSKKNSRAVKINYELASENNSQFLQEGILYVAVRKF